MRLEASNCIPSHTPFTPLQFRIVCHCIQLRERLFRLLLIAESSPSSHTARLSSQIMRLPSQAHGLGLRIIASHCNKHLPIAYRCFPSHQALFPLRIIASHCNDLPIIASHCKKHLSNRPALTAAAAAYSPAHTPKRMRVARARPRTDHGVRRCAVLCVTGP